MIEQEPLEFHVENLPDDGEILRTFTPTSGTTACPPTASIWNSLERCKLAVSLATPILVFGFGVWTTHQFREADLAHQQAASLKVQRAEAGLIADHISDIASDYYFYVLDTESKLSVAYRLRDQYPSARDSIPVTIRELQIRRDTYISSIHQEFQKLKPVIQDESQVDRLRGIFDSRIARRFIEPAEHCINTIEEAATAAPVDCITYRSSEWFSCIGQFQRYGSQFDQIDAIASKEDENIIGCHR